MSPSATPSAERRVVAPYITSWSEENTPPCQLVEVPGRGIAYADETMADQVCAGPADRTDDGMLWLLTDHRTDWPGWPDRMGVNEPPVCLPCARLSVRLCPALRKGAALVRAGRYELAGECTVRSTPEDPHHTPLLRSRCHSTTLPSRGYARRASSGSYETANWSNSPSCPRVQTVHSRHRRILCTLTRSR